MRLFARLAGVLATGSLLGAVVSAAPAQAMTATCQLVATAQANPAVPLTGGTGTYTLTTSPFNINCLTVDGDQVGVQQVHLESTGSYSSVVCGTMAFASSNTQNNLVVTTVLGHDFSAAYPFTTFGYKIETVDGNGIFHFTDPAITNGVGRVSLSIQGGGGGCTAGFEIDGQITFEVNSGLPRVVDSNSQACSTTSGNDVPGTHPAAGATAEGITVMGDAYAGPSGIWACAQAGPPAARVLAPDL